MKLNDEQKLLAEQHHNLIYSFLNKRGMKIDDWYDVLAIALCNAVLKYKPEKGKFSKYAFRAFDNAVKMEMRKNNSKKRNAEVVSIENIWNLGTEFDLEEMVLENVNIAGKLNSMDIKTAKVLNLYAKNKTQEQIAKELGISQAQVSRILNKLKRRLGVEK